MNRPPRPPKGGRPVPETTTPIGNSPRCGESAAGRSSGNAWRSDAIAAWPTAHSPKPHAQPRPSRRTGHQAPRARPGWTRSVGTHGRRLPGDPQRHRGGQNSCREGLLPRRCRSDEAATSMRLTFDGSWHATVTDDPLPVSAASWVPQWRSRPTRTRENVSASWPGRSSAGTGCAAVPTSSGSIRTAGIWWGAECRCSPPHGAHRAVSRAGPEAGEGRRSGPAPPCPRHRSGGRKVPLRGEWPDSVRLTRLNSLSPQGQGRSVRVRERNVVRGPGRPGRSDAAARRR